MKTRKAPGALDPAVVLPPPPRGCKICYGQTQDKSPCLCSERHDEHLFGRAKTGGLGQVTTKKNTKPRKKMGITTPRPDDGLQKKKKQTIKILCQCTFEMALLLQCA